MKKVFSILFVILLCFSLISCGKKPTQSAYTKEFSYLPNYSSNMKLESLTPASQSNQEFSTAKYTINNTTNADVLQNYEKVFKADGWTEYEDHKPFSIAFQKDTHVATIIPQQSGNNVILTVISK